MKTGRNQTSFILSIPFWFTKLICTCLNIQGQKRTSLVQVKLCTLMEACRVLRRSLQYVVTTTDVQSSISSASPTTSSLQPSSHDCSDPEDNPVSVSTRHGANRHNTSSNQAPAFCDIKLYLTIFVILRMYTLLGKVPTSSGSFWKVPSKSLDLVTSSWRAP